MMPTNQSATVPCAADGAWDKGGEVPHVGLPELLIVLLIVVMVFGVGKLPEVGAALGKSIREFRSASSEHETPPGEDKAKKA